MSTEFKKLVEEAGLTETLHSLTNFTMFLPSNEAVQVIRTCLTSYN